MFGKNITLKQVSEDTGKLHVKEIFNTIQGEWPLAGLPATFLRLAGCNLRCFFCDTDFDMAGSKEDTYDGIIDALLNRRDPRHTRQYVVVTGGEPFRQNFLGLMRRAIEVDAQFIWQVETAGTLYLEDTASFFPMASPGHDYTHRNSIVVSPKTPTINAALTPYIHAWKYIVRHNCVSERDGLPIESTQERMKSARIARPWDNDSYNRFFRPDGHNTVYLQPCDEQDADINQRNINQAVHSVMTYGYRLSIQAHKVAGLD